MTSSSSDGMGSSTRSRRSSAGSASTSGEELMKSGIGSTKPKKRPCGYAKIAALPDQPPTMAGFGPYAILTRPSPERPTSWRMTNTAHRREPVRGDQYHRESCRIRMEWFLNDEAWRGQLRDDYIAFRGKRIKADRFSPQVHESKDRAWPDGRVRRR